MEFYKAEENRYADMVYRRCGRSGILLPAVSLGLWHNFGSVDVFSNFIQIAHAAFDHGVTHFDLANNYGPAYGSAEENFGRILKKGLGAYRDEKIISTKAGYVPWPGPYGNWGSRKYLMASLDQSLKRMGLEYVDIFYSHRPDPETPIEETMEALDGLVKAGKVRAIGASAMYGYQFYNMQLAAKERGLTPFATMENHYNLLYREDERELIPICKQMNVALMPYSPLAAGHLSRPVWNTDSLRSQTDRVAHGKYDRMEEQDMKVVARVHELSEKHNCKMSQIALAWQWAKGVTAPIVGVTKTAYLDDAAGALDVKLSAEDVAYLEEMYVPHPVVGAIKENPAQGVVLLDEKK